MASRRIQKTIELKSLYDDYRTVYLNCKYYARRLMTVSRWNTAYEAVLAVGASGAIAGWPLWNTEKGRQIWTIFAGVVAVLVVLKPFLGLPSKIEQFSKLHTGYRDLYFDLDQIVKDIKTSQNLTKEMKDTVVTANKRFKKVVAQVSRGSQSGNTIRHLVVSVRPTISPPKGRLWSARHREKVERQQKRSRLSRTS